MLTDTDNVGLDPSNGGGEAHEDPTGPRPRARGLRFLLLPIAAVVVVGGAIGTLASLSYAETRDDARRAALDGATDTAEAKSAQVADWLADLRFDAWVACVEGSDPSRTSAWLRPEGLEDRDLQSRVEAHLAAVVRAREHSGAALFDVSGKVRASTGEVAEHVGADMDLGLEAIRSGRTTLSGLRRYAMGSEADDHIDVVVPLRATDVGPVIGGVLFLVNPRHELLPRLLRPAAPDQSVSLVARDRDVVAVMDAQEGTGFSVTSRVVPLADASPAERLGALATAGTVPVRVSGSTELVVAAVRPVPDTPWAIVVAHDTAGIVGSLRSRFLLDAVLAFAALAALAASLALGLRSHEARSALREAQVDRRRLAAEQRLAALARHANDAILEIDEEGTILDANDRAVESYGWPLARFLGMSFKDLCANGSCPPEEEAWRTGDRGVRFGAVHRRADGTTFPVEISGSRSEIGGRPHLLAIVRDVTERRTLEAELRQAQKMEAVGRLAGGVAHDFNNLLTVITGYGQLLLGRARADDPDRPRLDAMVQASERAARLTRQLLAFSRRQVMNPQILDVNGVLQGLDKILRRVIGEDVSVGLSLSPATGAVFADAGQVEQVILNLAVNARDAMPKGGTLEIQTGNLDFVAERVADVGKAPPGSWVGIAVVDSGEGMGRDVLDHLFEPFFTTKEVGKGTGLGLATVDGIVHQSGGHVLVWSEPGKGSRFEVLLPRVDRPAPRGGEGKPEAAAPGGSETVLVVEDDAAVRAYVVEALAGAGFTTLVAESAAQAEEIARARTEPIDLLLTDVVMPGKSGVDLAETLQASRPGLAVLLMSGYPADVVRASGRRIGSAPLLVKPFSVNALLAAIREALERVPAGV